VAPPRRRFGLSHARVKSDTIPRSTSSCSSSRHRHEFEGERYRRWLSLFFVFPLFSLFLFVLLFLFSLSHSSSHTHTLSLSLFASLTRSFKSPILYVCVFDLVRYLHGLSSQIAPGWGIRVFNSLPTANRQLCALSSPSDNSSLYSRQPTTPTKTQKSPCSTP